MSGPLSYRIELLEKIELLRECVELQRRAWGFSDEDLLPVRMLVVCSKIGGQVFGALANDKVLGFLNAFPGFRDGQVYLHSQMMGVLPEYQNLGIGKQLKLAQRLEALKRGISRIEWTFDPFAFRNAHFNIESLGAICRRFYVNMYGATSSQLQAGLPTDRLVAEWHVDSTRVTARISPSALKKRESESVFVEMPSDTEKLRSKDPELALQLQLDVRQQLLNLMTEGYCVTRFEIDPSQQKARYCLEPYSHQILDL
jgi:predicted GNAT superfamily acetyltransferase